jgi:hypothetical protein
VKFGYKGREDRRCRLRLRVSTKDCRCGTALHALAVDSVSAVTLEAARFAEADSQALVSSCMQTLGCLLL